MVFERLSASKCFQLQVQAMPILDVRRAVLPSVLVNFLGRSGFQKRQMRHLGA